jgi:hypothetical protein
MHGGPRLLSIGVRRRALTTLFACIMQSLARAGRPGRRCRHSVETVRRCRVSVIPVISRLCRVLPTSASLSVSVPLVLQCRGLAIASQEHREPARRRVNIVFTTDELFVESPDRDVKVDVGTSEL